MASRVMMPNKMRHLQPGAAGGFQGGEQGRGAVALAVMGAARGQAGTALRCLIITPLRPASKVASIGQ
jgi:hypothetical protein